MKKSLVLLSALQISFLLFSGCAGSENTDSASQATTDSSAVVADTVKSMEAAPVASPIEEIKYSYVETMESGDKTEVDAILKSGESSYFNGCSSFKLKELTITGSGNNYTIKVGTADKVIFERSGVDLSQVYKITDKDFKFIDFGYFEILSGSTSVFKHTFETSGCN